MIQIAVLNETSLLTDDVLGPIINALQIQVSRDFYPIYGVDARLIQIKKGQPRPPMMWWLVLLNTSDYAGALGYHDVTADGMPLAKVFIQSDIESGSSWTVTMSHELLEMLADPDISTVIEYQGTKKTVFFAKEICDPCEADMFGYKINDILVSDFVYPGWFHNYRRYQYFDQSHHITKPFRILKEGYIQIFDPTISTSWREVDAESAPPTNYKSRARVGSRRERRQIGRARWLGSTALPPKGK
jgi:hypothetical protein